MTAPAAPAPVLGASIPTTITDDAGNALKNLQLTVTGPNNHASKVTTGADGVLRLVGLPVGDYVVTNPATGRSGTVPVLPTSGDLALRDRATHTGVQPASSIDGLTEAVQDAVGQLIANSVLSGVKLVYDDANNRLLVTSLVQLRRRVNGAWETAPADPDIFVFWLKAVAADPEPPIGTTGMKQGHVLLRASA